MDSDRSSPLLPWTVFPFSAFKEGGLSTTNEEFKHHTEPDAFRCQSIAHPLAIVEKPVFKIIHFPFGEIVIVALASRIL